MGGFVSQASANLWVALNSISRSGLSAIQFTIITIPCLYHDAVTSGVNHLNIYETIYPEVSAGGFTRYDGTVQFFQRVQALIQGAQCVVDFGAGRGRAAESPSYLHRMLTDLRAEGRTVIGVDVDSAVLENRRLDKALVSAEGRIDLPDGTVDVIVADHVFEHIPDPVFLASEFDRVLRPGGWVCARTPYLFSALVAGSKLTPNRAHADVLQHVRPGSREARDVFPTLYRLNTNAALERVFPKTRWVNASYTWSPEPGYHFGRTWVVKLLRLYQYLKRPFGGEVLLVFLQKRAGGQ